MTKDIYDRFLARYQLDDPDPPPLALGPDDLLVIQEELSEVIDPLPLAELDAEERRDMAGKRFPELQDLIFECADGLRACPEIAEAADVSPEALESMALQDMAIGGFIKGLQAIAAGADTGLLLAARETDAACEEAEQRVQEVLRAPAHRGLSAGERRILRGIFAEAIRSRQAARQGPGQEPAAPAHEEGPAPKKQLVQDMLDDVRDGSDGFVGRALQASHK